MEDQLESSLITTDTISGLLFGYGVVVSAFCWKWKVMISTFFPVSVLFYRKLALLRKSEVFLLILPFLRFKTKNKWQPHTRPARWCI